MAWNNAKINLQRAVNRLAIDESIVIENFPAGMRIAGRWVESPAVTASVTASVQVASGEQKQLLPEGLRTTDAIEVWSTSEVRPLKREEGKPTSNVRWNDRVYSVEHYEDWYAHGRYWFAVCSLVDQ